MNGTYNKITEHFMVLLGKISGGGTHRSTEFFGVRNPDKSFIRDGVKYLMFGEQFIEDDDEPLSSCLARDDIAKARARLLTLVRPLSVEQLHALILEMVIDFPQVSSVVERCTKQDISNRKLFVRGLAWSTSESTLRQAFEMYGAIEECAIVRDRSSGDSKGYGFVTFLSMESAQKALTEPQKSLDGRLICCNLASIRSPHPPTITNQSSFSFNDRRLFVRGLSFETTSASLSAACLAVLQMDATVIEDCAVVCDRITGKSKGYGFVLLRTPALAALLVASPQVQIDGRWMSFHFANSLSASPSSSPTSVVKDEVKFKEAVSQSSQLQFFGSNSPNSSNSPGTLPSTTIVLHKYPYL